MQRLHLVLLLGITLKGTWASVEKDLQGLNVGGLDNLPELPGNISLKLPNQEDAEKLFEEKCIKNGGEKAYKRAQKAKNETIECVKGLIDFEELQKEMEIAKPSGDLDSVFKKYCRKSPDLVDCIERFTTELEPCLEEGERETKTIALNVTSQLVEFICHKEGDRIALFIAEGGPECLNASEKGINECVRTTFNKYSPEDGNVLQNVPLLLFQAEQCEDFSKLQKCVVKELEKCKEPTPGNVIDSLFNYVRKVTPCSKHIEASTVAGTSDSLKPSSVIIGTIINFFLIRYII